VNLLGTLYFSRIAVVYLRHGLTVEDDKSLVLLSSVSGFKETPGMPVYEVCSNILDEEHTNRPKATKHGVLGLMRCLRMTLLDSNIRVNAICPWFVDTIMTAGIREKWKEHKLPMNDPAGVAALIIGTVLENGMNGKAIYIEGNRGWEIEDNLERLEPQFLGEEQSRELNRGQELMGSVITAVTLSHKTANPRIGRVLADLETILKDDIYP
jgi:NAD(P)-dependent dehydrogenase (short-subunit alcohol dehydrogenase family)